MNILIIDPNFEIMKYRCMALDEAGFTVTQFNNVDEALQDLAMGSEYDCVVFEMVMPGGNNFRHDNTMDGMATGIHLSKRLREYLPKALLICFRTSNQLCWHLANEADRVVTLYKQDYMPKEFAEFVSQQLMNK